MFRKSNFCHNLNRIGEENQGSDHFKFTRKSQITSDNRNILSSAPKAEECVDVIDVEIIRARDKNLNEYNNIFDDRRVEFYYSTDKSK